jgi:diguanylate cyclase (GGDEF)-like protein
MRLIDRHDTSLAIALVLGALILFHQPLKFVFDAAADIERDYHLDLVQPLVVLAVVFGFHQYRKRQEAKGEALAAAAEAQQARMRTQELERLVGLGRGLASVTDFTGVSQVLTRYLPKFAPDHPAWVLICQQGCWDVLLREAGDREPSERLEAMAARALRADGTLTPDRGGFELDDLVAFPLWAGVEPVGVILVRNVPELPLADRRGIEAASALTAVAIRNVQSLIDTRDRSVRDGLTGCVNRAHGLERLTAELRGVQRHGRPLSALMFDVDSFKQVNDTYGHLAGDLLLAEIGRRLNEVVRTTDIKCRYGGDEFLVILPDTPAIGARHVAESLRQTLSACRIRTGDGAEFSVTVSLGVVTAQAEDRDAVAIVERADRALYRAKQRGRNIVSSDQPEPVNALRLVSGQG